MLNPAPHLQVIRMDGTIRDLAGLRGSYRIVDKTVRAMELLLVRTNSISLGVS